MLPLRPSLGRGVDDEPRAGTDEPGETSAGAGRALARRPDGLPAPRPGLPGGSSTAPRAGRVPNAAATHDPGAALMPCRSWSEARNVLAGLDGQRRMEAAVAAARRWPRDALEDIASLGLAALPGRGAVARAIVETMAPGPMLQPAARLAQRLQLSTPEAVELLARPLVERHHHAPLQVLQALGARPRDGLQGLRLDFELHGRPAFIALAEALLDAHVPASGNEGMLHRLSMSMAARRMDPQDTLQLATTIARRTDGQGLLLVLDALGLDEGTTCRLARQAASRCVLSDVIVGRLYTASEAVRRGAALGQQALDMDTLRQTGFRVMQGTVNLEVRSHCDLFAEGLRLGLGMLPRFGSVQGLLDFVRENWAPRFPDVDDEAPHETQAALQDAFDSFSPDAVLRAAFDKALAQPDDRHRGERMAWLLDCALVLGTVPDAQMPRLQADLAFLDSRHAPELRKRLTDALACDVNVHGGAARYADFADRFTRPHMRGFAMALYPLHAQEGAEPDGAVLAALRHDSVKNSRVQYPLLRNLLTLGMEPQLDTPAMRRLLERAVPAEGSAQQRSEAFCRNVRLLAVIVSSLKTAPGRAGHDALAALANAPANTELGRELEPLLATLMPGRGFGTDTQAAQPGWSRLLESRQAEPLLVYRQNLINGLHTGRLDEEELEPALEALDRYADAAVWSPEPDAAFARLRYDPAASPHLAHLQAHAPQAYEAWQRALPPVSLPGPPARTVVDTDRAVDLFLSGTDVGTCQSVSDAPGLSQALLGYVLDGKYRMLALQGDDGVTQARRMVRLLVDENTGKPALFVEELYALAGIEDGGPEDRALIALAQAKAEALGCPLVCSGDDTFAGDPLGVGLQSLGCAAPLEYVDACDIGTSSGDYRLTGCRVSLPPGGDVSP